MDLDNESKKAVRALLDESFKLQTGAMAKELACAISATQKEQFESLHKRLHRATEPLEPIAEKLEASSSKLETLLESDKAVLGRLEKLLEEVSSIQTKEEAQFPILQDISSKIVQLDKLKSDLEMILGKTGRIVGQEEEELRRLASLRDESENMGERQKGFVTTLETIVNQEKEELLSLQKIVEAVSEVRTLASAQADVIKRVDSMASTMLWLRRLLPITAGITTFLLIGIVVVLLFT